jgi:hypothetical protein
MTKNEWTKLFKKAINSLREQTFVPYDTGNLKFNAIKGIWVNETTYRIYIDESVAPYMKFTNEVWQYGKNPNEKWFDKAVKYVANYIAKHTNGEMK